MVPEGRQLYYAFRLASREWYESLDRYHAEDELLRVVRADMPSTWQLERSNVWFRVSPTEVKLPKQGWKIHVSATPDNCEDVLHNVATVCMQRQAPFKFALDRHILFFMQYKGWSRESSGKFITVYPLSDQHFHEIVEALYAALRSFVGPYVLSDRRYKDARVLHYRYGGIDGFHVLSVSGDRTYMLMSPNGDLFPDWRTPYWNPPPWISDPFEPDDSEEPEPVLKAGRYYIEQALGFSVTGGIYLATDRDTGSSVVVKEARPTTGVDQNGNDAVYHLQKEFRLLQKLHDTGITPAPIDLFWDWEHLFLVEEYVPGLDLGNFTIGFSPLMRVHPDEKTAEAYVEQLRKIWVSLAVGIAKMHENHIICGDLSLKNVIVRNVELGDVRIIDLEGAWEEGVDAPTHLTTPGFSSPTRRGAPSQEDDFYALGAVMLGTLFPMNTLLDVEPSARKVFADTLTVDLRLPEQIRQIVLTCMADDASQRLAANHVVEVIRRSPARFVEDPVDTSVSREDLLKIVSGVAEYIRASAHFDRTDRLFPADPLVFFTNPLSVAYGAVGIARALSRIEREIPKPVLAWILSRPVDPDHYTPGLYVGAAGIAWVLWDLGLEEVALQTLRAADNHPLLWDVADVFYGASGYGLTCLRFYLGTGDQAWLDRSVRVGEWLLRSKVEGDILGCCWPDKEGNVWLGYARGASGIALYLLYLSLATGERRFLEAGERALAFDLSHAHTVEEGHLSIPRGAVGLAENVFTHYWLDGTAGVATALVRYWACTKYAKYLDTLSLLAPDTFRKYTVFPSLFRGLSGLGNFLLDAYNFTGEEHYLHKAYKAASGIVLFKIQRPSGIAFPGEQLYRISTDFGTGSAGIALFLHRLAHVDQRMGNFNFTLDQLIEGQGHRFPLSTSTIS